MRARPLPRLFFSSRYRVVCTAVTLETVGEAARRFAPLAEGDMVQLSVTRTRTAGRYHLMDAQNPVWIFSGEGLA